MTQERKNIESAAAPIAPISSGPFEISPSSFGPPPSTGSPAARHQLAAAARAPMPLVTMVAAGAGVLVVLVGLALLLFR